MSEEERNPGKCDRCDGDLERVTDTTAHTYYRHTQAGCLTIERDAALARAEKAEGQVETLREAITSAMHYGLIYLTAQHMLKNAIRDTATTPTPIPTEEVKP